MSGPALEPVVAFWLGPVAITRTVVTTWGVTAALAGAAFLATRRMRPVPGPLQALAESLVLGMESAIAAVVPGHERALLPFIGTLWLYLGLANLVGVVPGLDSPTADLGATSALAIVVLLASHWYGARARGLSYLRHYLLPNPLMLPFHLMSEISRTVALAVRLFGNIMSLEIAALLILLVAGFLVPVPILMLHVIEALVQAYIFGMLALIYVGGGLQAQYSRAPGEENS
ncbi:MAG: F0F1 ATP synthase subunit A [Gammaproteobacteria bacterium]